MRCIFNSELAVVSIGGCLKTTTAGEQENVLNVQVNVMDCLIFRHAASGFDMSMLIFAAYHASDS